MYVRIDVYEDHDDGLRQRAAWDPDRLERTLGYNKKLFQPAVVVA